MDNGRSMRAVKNSLTTPLTFFARAHSEREKQNCRFSLTRKPRSQRLGLGAVPFEGFPLRLKPVVKGTLADALFVDPVGAH